MPVKKKNAKQWIWEFSKRIVTAYSIFYFIVIVFVCFVMMYYEALDHLDVLIDNINDTFRSCVFGYFVKAGVENVYKIAVKVKDADTE